MTRVQEAEPRSGSLALPPSFPELVRETIENEIIDGRLVAGERVSEDHIARRLGVSRTPVREAMRVLEGHGLIVRNRGKGTYVARRTTAGEARTLYELRAPLEGFLTERAAENISAAGVEQVELLADRFRDASSDRDALDLPRLIALDSELHWRIYEASRSELVSVVRSYWGRLLRELYTRAYLSEDPALFASQHHEIVAALGARDGNAARGAMEKHIWDGWEAVRASFESREELQRP